MSITPAPRADFPILSREVRPGVPLVYLDSGATSQKPTFVMDAVYYQEMYANGAVNRGSHTLAGESTVAYERARGQVAAFVGADADEIVWTKNSTEGINLLAYTFGNIEVDSHAEAVKRFRIGAEHNIVVTRAEHHANLVPWQELCKRTGATLRWLELTPDGRIDLATLDVIDDDTRVVAFGHVSNVTGAVADVAAIRDRARAHDAIVVLDACQSVPHMPVNFHELDVDFAVFSGHKMLGPTGIGALYGKKALLELLSPFLTGGSMVEIVTMEKTTFAPPPSRFEAGTQAIAQAVGMGAAAEYLANIGMNRIEDHERLLTEHALKRVAEIPGVRILGPTEATDRIGVVAFDVAGVHPHDVGQVLDNSGIAIRVGHHCAQPVHQHFGVFASSRVSFGPYNTIEEIDFFADALAQVRPFFGLEGDE